MRNSFVTLASLLGLFSGSVACANDSTEMLEGIKYPNSPEEGSEPVVFSAPAVQLPPGAKSSDALPGFSELVPYALPSPNQEEAGSCLYMSLTSAAEWWYAKLHPEISREPGGPLDFSERYLMNASARYAAAVEDESYNWKTDSVLVFNKDHKTVLNESYRFTKGWYKYDGNNSQRRARAREEGASYGTSYNWLDGLSEIRDGWVTDLPTFFRDVIFADPASNQWNVGVMPTDIVDRVKKALLEKRAPVQVIYNHFGYWHAVLVLGFDDQADSKSCRFTTRSREYFVGEAQKLRDKAESAATDDERQSLLKRAASFEATTRKLDGAMERGGGCSGKGVFYVRDSIYSSETEPLYDYDPEETGEERKLGPVVVMYEYEWLKYLSNHALQILVK